MCIKKFSGRLIASLHTSLVRLCVLFCVQGLILNPEPYYNEAGYEKQKGTQTGLENSRLYNEMAVLKLVQVRVTLNNASD